MSAHVIALGAWCDLVPPEEDHSSPGGASFRVSEFAVLADGRRLTLHNERGFTSWLRTSGQRQLMDPWMHLSRESVEADVRSVVLPDDDFPEDEHPYEWLRELLLPHGIEMAVEQLRSLPYTVEFSDRLERRFRKGRPPEGE